MDSLRPAFNKVHVKGYLKSKKLEMGKDSKGNSVVKGTLVILTTPGNEVTIDVYAPEFTTGVEPRKNKAYEGLRTVMATYKSMASLMNGDDGPAMSREEAMKACTKVTTEAQLSRREYYDQDGQLVSRDSVSSNFFSSVDELESPLASFDAEVFIRSFKEEYKNGAPTGRLLMDVYIPMFRGAILPFTFVVPEDIADECRNLYEPGQTALVNGDYVNRLTTTTSKASGFGRPGEVTSFVHELLVMGGNPAYGDGDPKAYKTEAIKNAEIARNNEYFPSLESKAKEAKARKSNDNLRQSAAGFTY